MVLPGITDIETLDTPEESKQFLVFFWCFLDEPAGNLEQTQVVPRCRSCCRRCATLANWLAVTMIRSEILDRGSYSKEAHRDLMEMCAAGQLEYLALIRRTSANVAPWDRGLEEGGYELEPYVRGSERNRPAETRNQL
jgi:hypothetical protein